MNADRRTRSTRTIVYFENDDEEDRGSVEVAMQWSSSYVESVFSFANNINTHEGGAHLSGFTAALTRTLNVFAKREGICSRRRTSRSRARTCARDSRPSSRSRSATRSSRARRRRSSATRGCEASSRRPSTRGSREYLDENPADRKRILLKAIEAVARPPGGPQGARGESQGRADRRRRCPGKLADCQSTDPEHCELYLVEGNSAGGSAVDARDKNFQAILPLRGKVINSEKNRINKVLSNTEIQAMITAIGAGIGAEFDIEKLRYHRVIVMTDADVDGSHIRTLLLTFFYRQMKELVEGGYVYIAVPPLYRVKVGNQERYVEKESQFEEILIRDRAKDIEVTDRDGTSFRVTEDRYRRLVRALNEFDGWLSRLRADYGNGPASFVVTRRLVETDAPVAGAGGAGARRARRRDLRARVRRRDRRRPCGSR